MKDKYLNEAEELIKNLENLFKDTEYIIKIEKSNSIHNRQFTIYKKGIYNEDINQMKKI